MITTNGTDSIDTAVHSYPEVIEATVTANSEELLVIETYKDNPEIAQLTVALATSVTDSTYYLTKPQLLDIISSFEKVAWSMK